MKKFILVVLALSLLVWITSLSYDKPRTQVRIGGETLMVWLADTQEARIQGLSGKKSLKEDEGMLFIFDNPLLVGFWMKDMHFAIDIIWIDENLEIIGIERQVEPETYPTSFYPTERIKYVLEVVGGFSDTRNIEVGDSISIGQ